MEKMNVDGWLIRTWIFVMILRLFFATDDNCLLSSTRVGDGICDEMLGYQDSNSKECQYDGGDCCIDTCILMKRTFECGLAGYHCIDPSAIQDEFRFQIEYTFLLGNVSQPLDQQQLQDLISLSYQKILGLSHSNVSFIDLRVSYIPTSKTSALITSTIECDLPTNDQMNLERTLSIMTKYTVNKDLERFVRLYARLINYPKFSYLIICPSFESIELCESGVVPPIEINSLSPNDTECTLSSEVFQELYNFPGRYSLFMGVLTLIFAIWILVAFQEIMCWFKFNLKLRYESSLRVPCVFIKCMTFLYIFVQFGLKQKDVQCIQFNFIDIAHFHPYYFYLLLWFTPLFVYTVGHSFLVVSCLKFDRFLFGMYCIGLNVVILVAYSVQSPNRTLNEWLYSLNLMCCGGYLLLLSVFSSRQSQYSGVIQLFVYLYALVLFLTGLLPISSYPFYTFLVHSLLIEVLQIIFIISIVPRSENRRKLPIQVDRAEAEPENATKNNYTELEQRQSPSHPLHYNSSSSSNDQSLEQASNYPRDFSLYMRDIPSSSDAIPCTIESDARADWYSAFYSKYLQFASVPKHYPSPVSDRVAFPTIQHYPEWVDYWMCVDDEQKETA